MAKKDYTKYILEIKNQAPYHAVQLRSGYVFKVMDFDDINKVIDDLIERNGEDWCITPPVYGGPVSAPPGNNYGPFRANFYPVAPQSLPSYGWNSKGAYTQAAQVTDPRAVAKINQMGKEKFQKATASLSMDDDLSAKALAEMKLEIGIDRHTQLKTQEEFREEDKFIDRTVDKFRTRAALKVRCEWCQNIFEWTMNSGPKVDSEKCGRKLADLLLEHPEIDKLPPVQRSIQIQSYRSLDAESFNDD